MTIRVGLIPVDHVRFHRFNTYADMGDLRSLAASIRKYGVMQPIVVEQQGSQYRLRAGHRRIAAARMIQMKKIPAVIHEDSLADVEWLEYSIQENIQRRQIDAAGRVRAVKALRELGCTWEGIAETFGVKAVTVRSWVADSESEDVESSAPTARGARGRRGISARQRAIKRLIDLHPEEFAELMSQEKEIAVRDEKADVDEVAVLRALNGERLTLTKAERLEVISRWERGGGSLNELNRLHGWNVFRDLRETA